MIARRTLIVLLIGAVFVAVASFAYVQFHYAYDMPLSPQPTTGRTYPITASGMRVYVTKEEFERARFVYDHMLTIGFGCALLGFALKFRFGLNW
jgi:hypothetical protein